MEANINNMNTTNMTAANDKNNTLINIAIDELEKYNIITKSNDDYLILNLQLLFHRGYVLLCDDFKPYFFKTKHLRFKRDIVYFYGCKVPKTCLSSLGLIIAESKWSIDYYQS